MAVVALGAVAAGVIVLGGSSEPRPSMSITAVASTGPGEVTVDWTGVEGANDYEVSVALDATMDDPVVHSFESSSGVLEGLKGGTRYFVTVNTLDDEGEALSVGPRSVVVRRAAPSDVTFEDVGPGRGQLAWKPVEGDVEQYRVRYADNADMTDAETVIADEDRATIKSLKPGQPYWFTVEPADDPSAVSDRVEGELPGSFDLEVGTFNVFGVNNDRNLPKGAAPWRTRRPVVVEQIAAADLDLVGLQELNQASSYAGRVDYGPNQMTDLRAALKAKSKHWELVNDSPYGPGSSLAARIIYRSDRLKVVDSGSVKYRAQTGPTARYMAWAIFEIKQTGTQVFFANTHLQPGRSSRQVSTKRSQWQQLIGETTKRAGDRPVVVVGDFNTSRHQQPGEMFERMRAAGFSELIGTRPGVNPPTQSRAKERIRGDISSYHGFDRNLPSGSCYCGSASRTGNSIDFIFATDALEVRRWELVANLSRSYQLVGTMPSDHHLITAELRIPAS